MLTRIKTLSAVLLLSAAGLLAIAPEARAVDNCQHGIYDSAPSENARWVVGDGYRFKVPENYSAQRRENGDIEVIDPDTVQFLNCVRRSNVGTGNFSYLTISAIDARVGEGEWPYNLPGFEWMGKISGIYYGTGRWQGAASFYHWSEYKNAYIFHGIRNLDNGGSAHVQSAGTEQDEMKVFDLAWQSLESYGH